MDSLRVGDTVKLKNDVGKVLEIKMIDFKKHYVLKTQLNGILTIPRDKVTRNGNTFSVI